MKSEGKIFGIGLSRTGTSSLHHILRQLGFKSKHCHPSLFGNPDWLPLDAFDAVSDAPIPLLYQECDRRFPNSKFILTTRDKDSWLTSMKWLFEHGKVIWDWQDDVRQYHKTFYKTMSFNKAILEKHWDDYHHSVNEYFQDREEDLLVINIDNGFNISQLCGFLEIPCQDVSVERKNTRRSAPFRKRLKYNLHWFGRQTLGLKRT